MLVLYRVATRPAISPQFSGSTKTRAPFMSYTTYFVQYLPGYTGYWLATENIEVLDASSTPVIPQPIGFLEHRVYYTY